MEILVLLTLILVNGLFSMSEMAVVSSRKARLQEWANGGRGGAQAALELANQPSNFLSTVQVGITIIGITSGAFGEATLAAELSEWLSRYPFLDQYSDGLALTIVVAGITIASLLLGELVPKRLALMNPEAVASLVSRPMRMLSRLVHPVVAVLSGTTEGILKLVSRKPVDQPPVTEAEINVLMEQGAEAGVFQEHEQQLVARVFRLDELKVTGIMTPRSDIVCLDLEHTTEANIDRIVRSTHSRFPVVRGSLDSVEGLALAKTLLADAVSGTTVDFGTRLQKPFLVPSTLTVMQTVELFKKHRQTLALVIDEFASVVGLVTLNDVMEALVGDIATVDEEGEPDIIERTDGSLLIDGSVTIERLKDVLDVERLEGEDEGGFHTLGGFVMRQLGRVPKPADHFSWGGFCFEVVDMDRHRVDKVVVSRLPGQLVRVPPTERS